MNATIPATLRLDNAANIYPASMSKHYTSLFRLKLCFTGEDIDVSLLQAALLRVSERIPTFRCTLKAGAFWWFLRRCDAQPEVLPLKPLKHFRLRDQRGLLYRVSVSGKELSLDVFHALADGFGALCFLLTLAGEYIRCKYGVAISYNSIVRDPSDPVCYAEVEDSFKTYFSGGHGQLEKNVDAYHIKGAALPHDGVKDLRAVLDVAELKSVCRQYDCTVTELLTAAMLSALQEEHRCDTGRKRSVLKVSVPVNLRPLYGSRTVRNFSSYVNLGVDIKERYLLFEELVAAVKAQKAQELRKENLEPKIFANVELEEMLLVRMLPLKVKHPIIDVFNLLHGDRYCSQTLSNMGQVDVPKELLPYISDIDFILGRQRGNSGAVSCLCYNGKLYLHLTRKIARDSFEQSLLEQLQVMGLYAQTSVFDLA